MSLFIKGVTKLSQLAIDAAKNWNAKKIENLGAPDTGDDAPRRDTIVPTVEAAGLALASGKNIKLIQALVADHTWSGITAVLTAGTALTIGQAVYCGGDSKMELADADAAASMPVIALATGTIAENDTGEFLLHGFFRDDSWTWTIGGLLYPSLTPGALTQDVSGYTTPDQVQVVGIAITATIILFNPSYELVEIS